MQDPQSTPKIAVEERADEGVFIVRIPVGLNDYPAVMQLGHQLQALIEEKGPSIRIVFNFRAFTKVPVSEDMLAIMIGLRQQIEPALGMIAVCCCSEATHEKIKTMHLDRLVPICTTVDEAVERLKGS